MADRHRLLVLDELEQLRAGDRGEWSGRAVGGLARILTRRYTDHIVAEHTLDLEERALIDEWALDWLRLVSYTPPITTGQAVAAATPRALDAVHRRSVVEAAVAVAEATSAACDMPVRAAGGWVDRAALEYVERLVDLALVWTKRVWEARRGSDRLASMARLNGKSRYLTRQWRARGEPSEWV